MNNRRRYKRLNVVGDVLIKSTIEELSGIVHNISIGGIGIETVYKLSIG